MSEQNIITKTEEPDWKKSPFIRFAMWVEYNDSLKYIADHDKCIGTYKNVMECGVKCQDKIIELSLINEFDKFTFNIKHKETQIIISGSSFERTFELFKKVLEVICND